MTENRSLNDVKNIIEQIEKVQESKRHLKVQHELIRNNCSLLAKLNENEMQRKVDLQRQLQHTENGSNAEMHYLEAFSAIKSNVECDTLKQVISIAETSTKQNIMQRQKQFDALKNRMDAKLEEYVKNHTITKEVENKESELEGVRHSDNEVVNKIKKLTEQMIEDDLIDNALYRQYIIEMASDIVRYRKLQEVQMIKLVESRKDRDASSRNEVEGKPILNRISTDDPSVCVQFNRRNESLYEEVDGHLVEKRRGHRIENAFEGRKKIKYSEVLEQSMILPMQFELDFVNFDPNAEENVGAEGN